MLPAAADPEGREGKMKQMCPEYFLNVSSTFSAAAVPEGREGKNVNMH
jgi:hypothetical protein